MFIISATGLDGGVEQVIGQGFDLDYTGFYSFPTNTLVGDTQFTFALENQTYLAPATDFEITVYEVQDAVGNSAAMAITEDLHFSDQDYYLVQVEAGEFYIITIDCAPDSLFSGFGRTSWTAATNDWESTSSSAAGQRTYVFAALEDGQVDLFVENFSSITRDGVRVYTTPELLDGLNYTITPTAGIIDDRAAVWPDLAGPMNVNQTTTALANGPRGVDGFVFDVVAGNSYSFVVDHAGASVGLWTDADGDGFLNPYSSDYPDTATGITSPGFAEQEPPLGGGGGLGFTNETFGTGRLFTFTAEYTGIAGVNLYPGATSGTYNVHLSDDGLSEAVIAELGITFGEGDDLVDGDTGDNLLEGMAGNDMLFGGVDFAGFMLAGDDTVFSGVGDDSFVGGALNDLLSGSIGSDTMSAGAVCLAKVPTRSHLSPPRWQTLTQVISFSRTMAGKKILVRQTFLSQNWGTPSYCNGYFDSISCIRKTIQHGTYLRLQRLPRGRHLVV